MNKDFHLLELHVCVLDSFVVCKVENSGNAVKTAHSRCVARLFSTIISRSKHNVLCHLFNSLHIYSHQSCLDPIPAGPLLYGLLVDIHLHLLFICLDAVTKEAEGKEHGLHMPEGRRYVNHQTPAGKWIQLGMVIAQMNENCVNSLWTINMYFSMAEGCNCNICPTSFTGEWLGHIYRQHRKQTHSLSSCRQV